MKAQQAPPPGCSFRLSRHRVVHVFTGDMSACGWVATKEAAELEGDTPLEARTCCAECMRAVQS